MADKRLGVIGVLEMIDFIILETIQTYVFQGDRIEMLLWIPPNVQPPSKILQVGRMILARLPLFRH